jgi:fatty acid synthase
MMALQGTVMVDPVVIHVSAQNYDWLPQIQAVIRGNSKQRIILVAQCEPLSGILGLVTCIRKEPGGESIRSGCYILSALSSGDVKEE